MENNATRKEQVVELPKGTMCELCCRDCWNMDLTKKYSAGSGYYCKAYDNFAHSPGESVNGCRYFVER